MYCSPCGACRQFLFEFNNSENGTEIIGLNDRNDGDDRNDDDGDDDDDQTRQNDDDGQTRQNHQIISYLLTDLLPKAFGPNNLK